MKATKHLLGRAINPVADSMNHTAPFSQEKGAACEIMFRTERSGTSAPGTDHHEDVIGIDDAVSGDVRRATARAAESGNDREQVIGTDITRPVQVTCAGFAYIAVNSADDDVIDVPARVRIGITGPYGMGPPQIHR